MNLIPILTIFLGGYLGYTVSPVRVDKQIFSAAEITETVEVQNVSQDTLRIKVEFEDFEIDRDGKVQFMPSSTLKNSVAAYMTVNPEEFYIAPLSRENVRITGVSASDAPRAARKVTTRSAMLRPSQTAHASLHASTDAQLVRHPIPATLKRGKTRKRGQNYFRPRRWLDPWRRRRRYRYDESALTRLLRPGRK